MPSSFVCSAMFLGRSVTIKIIDWVEPAHNPEYLPPPIQGQYDGELQTTFSSRSIR